LQRRALYRTRVGQAIQKIGGPGATVRALGVSRQTVNRWLHGAQPSVYWLKKLAEHADVELAWIAGG
jgi:hypothetical protein